MSETQFLDHPWAKSVVICDPVNQKTSNVLPKYNVNTDIG